MWAFVRVAVAVLVMLAQVVPGVALAGMITLSGEVTYRERIALPAGAMLRIRLVDLTDSTASPKVDVQAAIGSPGQVPLSFALNFDDLALVRTNQHALLTEITAGNELWFRNEEPYRIDPFAPAAPVVVVTTFAGRDLITTSSVETPELPSAAGDIVGVTWRATEIGGQPSLEAVDSTLLIDADRRVGGRGGCNNYFAHADIAGSGVRFSAVSATRMACVSDEATNQETAFFVAIENARFWRLTAEGLVLLDEDENEVLRFAAMTR